MIEAYEGVLLRNRRREREILNGVRHEEYERNRPPESKWYEFKHNGFNKELYRNRVALKPNNENKVYLERLQDKDIYWPFNNRLDNYLSNEAFHFFEVAFRVKEELNVAGYALEDELSIEPQVLTVKSEDLLAPTCLFWLCPTFHPFEF